MKSLIYQGTFLQPLDSTLVATTLEREHESFPQKANDLKYHAPPVFESQYQFLKCSTNVRKNDVFKNSAF